MPAHRRNRSLSASMTIRKTENPLRGDRTPAYVDRETGAAELLSPATWDNWVADGSLPPPCDAFPDSTPRWRWKDVDRKPSGRTVESTTALMMAGALNFGKKGTPKTGARERLSGRQPANCDPLAAAYERLDRDEISLDQLPPGKYPNGMRVYADGEWEAIARSRPLGKLERANLAAYFKADGKPDHIGGIATNEKLEARGFIEIASPPRDGRLPE